MAVWVLVKLYNYHVSYVAKVLAKVLVVQANDLLALKKSVTDHLLKEHTIQISTVLNLPFLMPYLIQHGCLTDEEMDHFPRTESRRTNNLKFKRMIQE